MDSLEVQSFYLVTLLSVRLLLIVEYLIGCDFAVVVVDIHVDHLRPLPRRVLYAILS